MTSRFNSGISIEQARKDAKKISKSDGIPLHEALDKVAKAHNGEPWNKSVHLHKRISAVNFSFNAEAGGHIGCGLNDSQPLCIIDGVAGSGKTIAALFMAQQCLRAGIPVDYLSGYSRQPPLPADEAAEFAEALYEEHPEFSIYAPEDLQALSTRLLQSSGHRVLIVDEHLHLGSDRLFTDMLLPLLKRTRNIYVMLLTQTLHDIHHWLCNGLSDHLSFILVGRFYSFDAKRESSPYRHLLNWGQSSNRFDEGSLGVFKPESRSRFLLVQNDQSDVVSFTFPSDRLEGLFNHQSALREG